MFFIKRRNPLPLLFYVRNHSVNSRYYGEILPRYTKKVFTPNPSKVKMKTKTSQEEKEDEPRINKFNIQMLSKPLYKKVFGDQKPSVPNARIIAECLKSLEEHGMLQNTKPQTLPDVDFQLPPIKGKNLIEHFQLIGEEQTKPYKDIVQELLAFIPPMPKKWLMQSGWTRYAPNFEPESVPFPLENGLVFDVEVCLQAGKAPTLATAVSNKAWYVWVSESLIDGTAKPVESHHYTLDDLIPLESAKNERRGLLNEVLKKPKIIVGHNVSYDRARIKEQYWLELTGARFLDTMSLHICISGLTSYQRAVLKSGDLDEDDDAWKHCSSLNSLSEVHKLYCGTSVDKETRDLFVEGTLKEIQEQFDKVVHYCANDVQSTYNVLKVLYPMFLKRFPHPVTFAGMLELSTAYLPVNSNWERYVSDSEQTYEDLDIEGKIILARRADQACQLFHNEEYKRDLWMWDQDWSINEIKMRKTYRKKKDIQDDESSNIKLLESILNSNDVIIEDNEFKRLKTKFSYLEKTAELLPTIKPLLPGYPAWYRKMCTKPDSSPDWVPGPTLISTSMQITPKLLCLTWEGYPLHFIRGLGWGFLVPFSEEMDLAGKIPLEKLLEKCPLPSKEKTSSEVSIDINKEVEKNLSRKEYYSKVKKDQTQGFYQGSGIWCNTVLDDCCWFMKLPHKDGPSYRVGNPLAKDFLIKFSENVLAGDTEGAEKVLSIARKLSYWKNNRTRIMEQMVVWLDRSSLPPHLKDNGIMYGAIIPQIVVCGTLTRRAVEPTWMTASNAHPERIGSELRCMVQAPEGYNIVGADVDTQELWIASIIGDSFCAKMPGATPFGWMNLSGNKSEGTDMHSVTAKIAGISRPQAKVINFARIYGAGQNFAEQVLKQFNPTMSDAEVRSKANKMFAVTKGKRIFRLKEKYLLDLPDKPYGRWQAHELAKIYGKTLNEMFYKGKWVGGTESVVFNRLEEIASQPEPVTPFLNCQLSRAIEPKTTSEERFMSTRINWVVQSGAVDFLHLMLVCMRWIMKDKIRFCLSFHDEVRYLVKDSDKYKAALALHVTNLFTRAFCSMKLGLNDLPQSVAFFSTVEVDTVLRKESKQDCNTPSNPHGLSKGYGIPHGESLNIYEAIEKANGHAQWWQDPQR